MCYLKNILFDEYGNYTNNGIVSFCIANKIAIKAVLMYAKKHNCNVLLEATSNQVNQLGGYTGMKPNDYKQLVLNIAEEISFKPERILFGGDHLGPLPFSKYPTSEAMLLAEKMVSEYVLAGFTKIHLDTSMYLGDDSRSHSLSKEIIAERGVRLIKVAEESYQKLLQSKPDQPHPVYIIGSEVPPAGGQDIGAQEVSITAQSEISETLVAYRKEIDKEGLSGVWQYIIALVIQPGVEYGNTNVVHFDEQKFQGIHSVLNGTQLVFEGHSTDYQLRKNLARMVKNRIAILKVGPAITAAMREALFSLESIEKQLYSTIELSNFSETLFNRMKENPLHWRKYYNGSNREVDLAIKYSLLDRCRYYYSDPTVAERMNVLLENVNRVKLPAGLIKQYFPNQFSRLDWTKATAKDLIYDYIAMVIEDYYVAINNDMVPYDTSYLDRN